MKRERKSERKSKVKRNGTEKTRKTRERKLKK